LALDKIKQTRKLFRILCITILILGEMSLTSFTHSLIIVASFQSVEDFLLFQKCEIIVNLEFLFESNLSEQRNEFIFLQEEGKKDQKRK